MAKRSEAKALLIRLPLRPTRPAISNTEAEVANRNSPAGSEKPRRGRRLLRDRRRAELIETAIKVMKERGDVRARVADVTRAAGVAKGTFYVHFDSWEKLVLAVHNQLSVEIQEGMMQRAKNARNDSWCEFLEREAAIFVDTLVAMGPLRRVVLYGPTDPQPDVDGPVVKTIRALIKIGVSNRAFAIDDPKTAGTLMFSAWRGAIDVIVARGNRTRHLRALRQMMRGWLSVADRANA